MPKGSDLALESAWLDPELPAYCCMLGFPHVLEESHDPLLGVV